MDGGCNSALKFGLAGSYGTIAGAKYPNRPAGLTPTPWELPLPLEKRFVRPYQSSTVVTGTAKRWTLIAWTALWRLGVAAPGTATEEKKESKRKKKSSS